MKKVFVIASLALFLAACQESLEDRCQREVREYNVKNCPAALDKNLAIDSMAFDRRTHTISYYYRLIGQAENIPDEKKDEIIKQLTLSLKNTTSMKAYKDADYNFTYYYRSNSDPEKVILQIELTPKNYK